MSSSLDLHLHTSASDGSDSVPELLEKLRACGIRTFSVTDHDTIAGAREMAALVPEDFRFFPGVELSCRSAAGKCHILGYGFDPDSPFLQAALAEGHRRREQKLQRRLEHLDKNFSVRFSAEELDWLHAQTSPGKPHLAQLLVRRGIAPDITAAIQTYLNGCRGGEDRIEAAMAIEAISRAGGIPLWAHPLGGEGERRLSSRAFATQLIELCALGIRGLEVYYSRYAGEDAVFLASIAQSRGLLISGGSDYHGAHKKGITPGMLRRDNLPVDERRLTVLTAL